MDVRAGRAYERGGDVKDVVFPCGQTIDADGDTIHLYYGAADSTVALATGSIRCLLAWLDAHSSSEQTFSKVHWEIRKEREHERYELAPAQMGADVAVVSANMSELQLSEIQSG